MLKRFSAQLLDWEFLHFVLWPIVVKQDRRNIDRYNSFPQYFIHFLAKSNPFEASLEDASGSWDQSGYKKQASPFQRSFTLVPHHSSPSPSVAALTATPTATPAAGRTPIHASPLPPHLHEAVLTPRGRNKWILGPSCFACFPAAYINRLVHTSGIVEDRSGWGREVGGRPRKKRG